MACVASNKWSSSQSQTQREVEEEAEEKRTTATEI